MKYGNRGHVRVSTVLLMASSLFTFICYMLLGSFLCTVGVKSGDVGTVHRDMKYIFYYGTVSKKILYNVMAYRIQASEKGVSKYS